MTTEHESNVVGLLCGSGALPLCVARSLQARGVRVVAIGIKGEAGPALDDAVPGVTWTGVAKLGKWIKVFRKAGVQRMLMVGGIAKRRMYESKASLMPDLRSAKLLYKKLRSKGDHTILAAVVEEFESEGIRVCTVPEMCPELIAPEGCLTQRTPTDDEWADIRFAWPQIKAIARMQIGQSIVVQGGAVVAVEGMDGTDATIRRAGELTPGGAVVVKVPREDHDERFDIPGTGPATIDAMVEARAACLAVEAGRTILLEREELVRRADTAGIAVVCVDKDPLHTQG
jgi:UDP-2,3-diacylglucosamine hydrolase